MLQLLALSSLSLASPVSIQETSTALFAESGRAQELVDRTPVPVRSRAIEVNLDRFDQEGASLQLALFDGEALTAHHDHTGPAYGGGFVWSGTIEGHQDADAVFSVMGNAVVGTILVDDRVFRIIPDADGVTWLTLEDPNAFPECGVKSAGTTGGLVLNPLPNPDPGTGPLERAVGQQVDVMVVYSNAARNAVGGRDAMLALINLAVKETNDAYNFSGAVQRLKLVFARKMFGYAEPSSMSTILNHLRSKTDGQMDEVHEFRTQFGADAVAMICQRSEFCGIASLMTNVSAGFESSAFSVTSYSCATGYFSFGHELGHNFGCAHDRANAGSGAYSHSFGFRTANNARRTIMAYSPGTRVKRFSGPAVMYQGSTMGTATEDNARSIDRASPTVAAWRATVQQPELATAGSVTAGATANFEVVGTPGATAGLALSLAGGGPMATNYGTALLSNPIYILGTSNFNGAGDVTFPIAIPPGVQGVTIWLQALDFGVSIVSNGVEETIN